MHSAQFEERHSCLACSMPKCWPLYCQLLKLVQHQQSQELTWFSMTEADSLGTASDVGKARSSTACSDFCSARRVECGSQPRLDGVFTSLSQAWFFRQILKLLPLAQVIVTSMWLGPLFKLPQRALISSSGSFASLSEIRSGKKQIDTLFGSLDRLMKLWSVLAIAGHSLHRVAPPPGCWRKIRSTLSSQATSNFQKAGRST